MQSLDAPQTAPESLSPFEAKPLWHAGPPGARAAYRLCDAATIATAAAFAVPVGELRASTRRSAYAAFARQSAMYLSHVAFGIDFGTIGAAFGRDRTTAAYACRLVEERRDDPAVDAVLSSLEGACRALRGRLTVVVLP